MPDGTVWALPIEYVARDRATYYAKLDSDGDDKIYKEIFDEELKFLIENDYELLDWIENNMDWGDFNEELIQLKPQKVDYAKEFFDAKKTIEQFKLEDVKK